jgi:hypothetical protein
VNDEDDELVVVNLTEADLAILRWVASIRPEDCVDLDPSAYVD